MQPSCVNVFDERKPTRVVGIKTDTVSDMENGTRAILQIRHGVAFASRACASGFRRFFSQLCFDCFGAAKKSRIHFSLYFRRDYGF